MLENMFRNRNFYSFYYEEMSPARVSNFEWWHKHQEWSFVNYRWFREQMEINDLATFYPERTSSNGVVLRIMYFTGLNPNEIVFLPHIMEAYSDITRAPGCIHFIMTQFIN